MHRLTMSLTVVLALALTAPALQADVKTRSKSTIQFEGLMGRIMNMAIDNDTDATVAVRGNRMSTRDGDNGQIIDLAEERVYTIDYDDRRYRVQTFAEIRAELEELRKKMEESAASREGAQDQPPSLDMEFEVAVDQTGKTDRINGMDARQVILTITAHPKGQTLEQGGGFVMTNDMWLIPTRPEVQEIAEFTAKYAQAVYGEALGIDPRQAVSMAALIPALGTFAARMQEEAEKLDGTAIRSRTVFETVRSEAQMKEAQSQNSGGGGIGGMLARRLAGNRNNSPRSTVMTTTHELSSISTDVTDADVQIPEGFRERR
jgi:hypothetical protein